MIPVIPDKIYLGIQDLGSNYVYNMSLDNNGEQEYIRKDALMEWAKENMDSLGRLSYGELIDKLNSM